MNVTEMVVVVVGGRWWGGWGCQQRRHFSSILEKNAVEEKWAERKRLGLS